MNKEAKELINNLRLERKDIEQVREQQKNFLEQAEAETPPEEYKKIHETNMKMMAFGLRQMNSAINFINQILEELLENDGEEEITNEHRC